MTTITKRRDEKAPGHTVWEAVNPPSDVLWGLGEPGPAGVNPKPGSRGNPDLVGIRMP